MALLFPEGRSGVKRRVEFDRAPSADRVLWLRLPGKHTNLDNNSRTWTPGEAAAARPRQASHQSASTETVYFIWNFECSREVKK